MDTYILGSGKLYVTEFAGGEIPEKATIETEDNLLGLIQGGASLSYKDEYYTSKDDLGLLEIKKLTNEEVIFKSGIMTWNGNTLNKLCSTATVTEDAATQTRIVKIGGIGKYNGKKYVVRFVYTDNNRGDVRTTIVGSNEAGFEFAFAKDKETVVNVEFKAQPHDNEGTLIIYEETDTNIVAPARAMPVSTAKA